MLGSMLDGLNYYLLLALHHTPKTLFSHLYGRFVVAKTTSTAIFRGHLQLFILNDIYYSTILQGRLNTVVSYCPHVMVPKL